MRPLAAPEQQRTAQPDNIFPVASLTKPLTAAGLCLLVDRGRLSLDDALSMYIPEFSSDERPAVHLRHLLTHTSGLPDMLPENVALRQAHAPLSAFVRGTCVTPLLYSPGTDCRYQSMGTLLAATVVERLTGAPLPDFLAGEFFAPLGMKHSWLGLGTLERSRMARVILPPEDEQTDWGWGSLYWRDLGSPWAGLHTTASDYARFLQLMLNLGEHDGRQLLSAAMVQSMLTDQIAAMPGIPTRVKRKQAWGLGWRLNHPPGSSNLPDYDSERIFGHGGATGTVAWADPDSGLVCVILTNDPQSGTFRSRMSKAAMRLTKP
jgi:CubicO group peptidase (beta-lactamase class C family)